MSNIGVGVVGDCFSMIRMIWLAFMVFFSSASHATITFTKFMVAETPAAFAKGVVFPLIGLSTDKPTFVAARVYKWTQRKDNMYVLEATDDFTVYPQLLRMSPSTRKSIMIKSTVPLAADNESFYRIILKEFDRVENQDVIREQESSGLNVTVKPTVSLPLVVRGPSSLKAEDLVVESIRAGNAFSPKRGGAIDESKTMLVLYNPGKVLQHIHAIGINVSPGRSNQFNGYVLPGQRVAVPANANPGDEIKIAYSIGVDAKINMNSDESDDRRILSVFVK